MRKGNYKSNLGSPTGVISIRQSEPTRPTMSEWTVRKMNSKLRNSPITLFLNPGEEALKVAQPYPVINGNNSPIERSYGGERNLNGNIVNQMVLDPRSKLINEFDSGKSKLTLAYRYLAMRNDGQGNPSDADPQKFIANNVKYASAFSTGFSTTTSELWSQTSYPTSTITTTMPGFEDGLMAAPLIHYQVVLQNLALILAKFNQLNLLQQDLINMGWQREENILIQLFSLMKKKTFVDRWTAMSNYIKNEFFDAEWARQINNLCNIPSRKSTSVRDPLLTVVATHIVPDITITSNGSSTPYFNSAEWLGQDYEMITNEDGITIPVPVKERVTFEHLCYKLIDLLDQNTIVEWARSMFNDSTDLPYNIRSVNQFINYLTLLLDSISMMMNKFKVAYTDMRVFLSTAKRAGLIKWDMGTEYSVFKPMAVSTVANNLNVRDMIVATCATPSEINFNYGTQTWTFLSLWDEYDGVPQFDMTSGGAEITFSTKAFIGDNGMNSTDMALALPILFKHMDNNAVVHFVNRGGITIDIQASVLTAEQVMNNVQLSRLIPFDDQIAQWHNLLTVPTVVYNAENPSAGVLAAISRLLLHYFKMGIVDRPNGVNREITTYLSSTMISVVDGQINSIVDSMNNYIESSAPLSTIARKSQLRGF